MSLTGSEGDGDGDGGGGVVLQGVDVAGACPQAAGFTQNNTKYAGCNTKYAGFTVLQRITLCTPDTRLNRE
jgi:hypothetical protein